jgi:hypothetical protein
LANLAVSLDGPGAIFEGSGALVRDPVLRIGVAMLAVGLVRPGAPLDVLVARDGLQMAWVAAGPHPAQVVNL